MSNYITHPCHLVDESPWPLLSAGGAFILTSGLVQWFSTNNRDLILVGLWTLALVMFQWWRDVINEGTNQGRHTKIVELGLRWGIILFIVSEVFFFLSFFWAFFHCSLAPDVRVGNMWPPAGIMVFNPFQVPLLNTIVLLSSGVSVTWAHHAIINSDYSGTLNALKITIILGVYFTCLQWIEYEEASFRIADRIYGSTFFVATGFHGLHVLIGTTFLAVATYRLAKQDFSPAHHFGFEAAAWYWHFVDVVWLFLYVWFYWWGGK